MLAQRKGGDRAGTRLAEVGMTVEQLKTGRGWHVSAPTTSRGGHCSPGSAFAERVRSPSLRLLMRRALIERGSANGLPSLWDDVFRLALMTGIAQHTLVVARGASCSSRVTTPTPTA